MIIFFLSLPSSLHFTNRIGKEQHKMYQGVRLSQNTAKQEWIEEQSEKTEQTQHKLKEKQTNLKETEKRETRKKIERCNCYIVVM